MVVHPIEYRYGSSEMRSIFDIKNKIKLMIEVEIAILEALEECHIIPKGVAEGVKNATTNLSIENVIHWEQIVKHETMALVMAMTEVSGEFGKYIHLGATSNDILDTVMAIQIRDACNIILRKLLNLIIILMKLAWRERKTACIGRTHGRAAIPTSFGYRILQYVDELINAYKMLARAMKNAAVGKYSGAVGIYAELGKVMKEVEHLIMKRLGLGVAKYSTQVVPRDRLSTLMYTLILVSTILDHLGREIRNLQRSGIEEVYEPFGKHQVGSSVMPHKRNPILSEKVCGLAKFLRGHIIGFLENIALEHERDLTNSSFERTALPEVFLILDEQLETMNRVVENLVVNRNNMINNIKQEGIYIYFDLLVQRITLKGGNRQEAHHVLRELYLQRASLEDVLSNEYIRKYLSEDEILEAMNTDYYVNLAAWKVEALIKEYCEEIGIRLDQVVS